MIEYTQEMTVEPFQTAQKMGSGTLEVLATPALIAFMENTAMKMIDALPETETSVGTKIHMQHLRASAIGERISCTARITGVEGRKYCFELTAHNSANEIIGSGVHERFVVNTQRFMEKIGGGHAD